MTLAVPQALWLLAGIPVLIFLHMLRARRQSHTVSSLVLWQRAARDLQTRIPIRRLERSLLLLLQILAVALLALALARPAVVLPGIAGPGLVVVVDTSLSMQAREGAATRLALAQAEAVRLLERLGGGQPGMVIEAGPRPRVAAGFTTDRRALARVVRALAPTDGQSDLTQAARMAAAQRVEGRSPRVAVVTDHPGPALSRVTYHLVGLPAQNLAVTRATSRIGGDGQATVLAEVRNFGSSSRTVTLQVDWPDGSVQRTRLTVPAAGSLTRTWPARGNGVAHLAIQAGDALPADDRAAVVVGDAALPRVLLVGRGNPYLEAALAVLPLREVRRTDTADPAVWTGFDLIVLDRTPPQALPPGRYLLVGTVPENVGASADGIVENVVVRWMASTHPLLRLVDLTGVRVEQVLRLRIRGAEVLAEGEAPVLWAVDRGDLRALILPFDLQRSDLSLHPAFPVLMANALAWLAPPVEISAGETPLIPAGVERRASLITPSGRPVPVGVRAGLFAMPRLDRAGIYRLRTGSAERVIVVRAAAGEESELRSTGRAPGAAAPETGLRRHELWFTLLAVALLALLLEAALWLRSLPGRSLSRRAPGRGGRRAAAGPHPAPLLTFRAAVTVALILALAGVQVAWGGAHLSVVFALDLSDSIPQGDRARALGLMRNAAAAARPGDRIGLITFGADAQVDEGLAARPRLIPATRPRGERTDLGRAVRAAADLLPASGGRRIVLFTDGHDTEGGAAQALAEAAAVGIDVGVVPLGGPALAEARVDLVHAPQEVRAGERFELGVWIESAAPAAGRVQVYADGRLITTIPVRLREGRTFVRAPLVASAPGAVAYEVALDVAPDAIQENNRGYTLVEVTGPPVVLYVSEDRAEAAGRRVLPRWLRAQGIQVREITPAALPTEATGLAGGAAVVLDDVPAPSLSRTQQRALRDYVSALGGGLVAVGGPHAFGPGGYAGTDLEAALPVTMDVRHRVALPSMAVVLVLDASGSMGSFGPEIAKVELAKEAAQSVVDLLGEHDLIGVIAFDQDPHWLVRLTAAAQRQQILAQVARITAGGGTNLYPALREAFLALDRTKAKIKHVIILSDGQTDPGDFERLARQMTGRKITVSSVAIGADADREIMRNLAAWGRGRAYYTKDLHNVPQIFTAEALLATRAYLVEERFVPLASPQSTLIRGVGPFPALRGYVATAPRPAATLHLISPQHDPILATWQHGLGRAVAFTSDAQARWGTEWLAWADAPALWSRVMRWAMRPDAGALDVHANARDDRITVLADARDAQGRPLTDLAPLAQLVGGSAGEDARPTRLTQTAPGRYEGLLAAPGPGAYLVTVEARRGGRLEGAGRTGVSVGYTPELKSTGTNQAGLLRLVEGGALRILSDVAEILAPPPARSRTTQPAWPALAALALGLFMAEVTLRRLPVIGEWTGRGLTAALAWVRHRDAGPPPPEDAEYERADRWQIPPTEEDELRRADMGQAARLYIARLRKQEDEGSHERGR